MSETPGGRNVRAVKLIAIDNSKGRSDSLVLEETGDGIFLHGPQKKALLERYLPRHGRSRRRLAEPRRNGRRWAGLIAAFPKRYAIYEDRQAISRGSGSAPTPHHGDVRRIVVEVRLRFANPTYRLCRTKQVIQFAVGQRRNLRKTVTYLLRLSSLPQLRPFKDPSLKPLNFPHLVQTCHRCLLKKHCGFLFIGPAVKRQNNAAGFWIFPVEYGNVCERNLRSTGYTDQQQKPDAGKRLHTHFSRGDPGWLLPRIGRSPRRLPP